jgi:hypothetical protein
MSLWFALTRNLLLVRKRSNARAWATAANERQAGGQDHRSRRRERRERGSPRVVQRCHEPQRRFLAAQQLGAERIIAFSRHADRQALARKIGATDIVEERGDAGVEKVKGADRWPGRAQRDRGRRHPGSHAAGHPSWTRAGGHVGFVGVSHDVPIPGDELFMGGVHIHGGPAPVRRFLPELIRLIWDRKIDAGKVVDLTLPLDRVAEGYKAMDQRRRPRSCSRSEPPPGVYRQRQPFVGVPDALTRHTETPCQPHVRSSGPRC